MTRDENGRLQTSEYHVLPNEVYELLATVGEFSDFSNTEDGKVFDIDGYAAKYTNGDVEKATKIGCIAAGLATTKAGAVDSIPSLEEITNIYEQNYS